MCSCFLGGQEGCDVIGLPFLLGFSFEWLSTDKGKATTNSTASSAVASKMNIWVHMKKGGLWPHFTWLNLWTKFWCYVRCAFWSGDFNRNWNCAKSTRKKKPTTLRCIPFARISAECCGVYCTPLQKQWCSLLNVWCSAWMSDWSSDSEVWFCIYCKRNS